MKYVNVPDVIAAMRHPELWKESGSYFCLIGTSVRVHPAETCICFGEVMTHATDWNKRLAKQFKNLVPHLKRRTPTVPAALNADWSNE